MSLKVIRNHTIHYVSKITINIQNSVCRCTNIVTMTFLIRVDSVAPRAKDYLTKNHNTSHQKPFAEFLIRVVQETRK